MHLPHRDTDAYVQVITVCLLTERGNCERLHLGQRKFLSWLDLEEVLMQC